MLIILGGLPGTGKTTIARSLARQLKAVHLRIDSIEEALISCGVLSEDLGPAGYVVAYALARDNLLLGHTVIADSVNPIEITRMEWRSVGTQTNSKFIEVEVICSNSDAHKKRIETREYGVRTVTWQHVLDREYEPWTSATLRLDTAKQSAEECLLAISRFC